MSDNVQIIVHYGELNKSNNDIKNFGKIKYNLPMINACVLEVKKENVKEIEKLKKVEKFELDTHITAQMRKTRDLIKLDYAHNNGIYGHTIGVAVLDTGICEHSDFLDDNNNSRVIGFVDFVNNRRTLYDDNGHGTHVAGL